MNKAIALALCLILAGCATTSTTQLPAIPVGCETSIVYTKLSGFMPNGPMITRVGISTALAVLSVAEPQIGRSAQLLMQTVMPILYKATLNNNLIPAMTDVKERFQVSDKYIAIISPLLVLFDALNQSGPGISLTDCDKNVLASLFKNIGLDSGTDPALFD